MTTQTDRMREALELANKLERDKWHVTAVTMQRAANCLRVFAESSPAAEVDGVEFRLRTARRLAELHGEDVLSEQQCAKWMGIDLVSWRKLETCFSAGVWQPEGEPGAEPIEDSKTILRAALAPSPEQAGQGAQNPRFTMDEWTAHARKHKWRFDLEPASDGVAAQAEQAAPEAGEPMIALFREALAFGLVYGPEIPKHQWDEMRDSKAQQLTDRASRGIAEVSDEQWYDIAQAHASKDWNGPGYFDSIKSVGNAVLALVTPQAAAPAAVEGWVYVPREPTESMLRPFYECPPKELILAWNAMVTVTEVAARRAATPPHPAAGKDGAHD